MAAMMNTDVAGDGSIRTRNRGDPGRHGVDGGVDDHGGGDDHAAAVADADACVQPSDWQQSFPVLGERAIWIILAVSDLPQKN